MWTHLHLSTHIRYQSTIHNIITQIHTKQHTQSHMDSPQFRLHSRLQSLSCIFQNFKIIQLWLMSLRLLPKICNQQSSRRMQILRLQMQNLHQLHILSHLYRKYPLKSKNYHVLILIILQNHGKVSNRHRKINRCWKYVRLSISEKSKWKNLTFTTIK